MNRPINHVSLLRHAMLSSDRASVRQYSLLAAPTGGDA